MEILWWLVPAALATVLAMLWVSWSAREARREVDREVAVARLAEALAKEAPRRTTAVARPRDRSTGIAVRPSRRQPGTAPQR